MPSNKLFIILNNCAYGYFPGSTVSGQVIINNDRVQKIKGIKITLGGAAEVCFRGRHHTRHDNPFCNAFEQILGRRLDLLSFGARAAKLQPGWHMYPFQFKLPLDIPSSFARRDGKVEYKFTATMKRSFNINKTATLPLIVSDHLDLNNEPQAKIPITAQVQKTFLCLRCTGPIEILFTTTKRGFVSGENVTMNLDIDNRSDTRVRKTEIFLIQEAAFHASTRTSTNKQRILLSTSPSVPWGQHKMFTVNVKIPNVHATNLSCHSKRIITLQYFLEIRLQFSFWQSDFATRIPIIIGTVPLQIHTYHQNVPNSGFQNPLNNYDASATIAPTYPQNTYNDYPTHSNCPNPIAEISIDQDFDNASISSVMSLPPAYANFSDLPPSYADAIKLDLEKENSTS